MFTATPLVGNSAVPLPAVNSAVPPLVARNHPTARAENCHTAKKKGRVSALRRCTPMEKHTHTHTPTV
jgi:hypothetical protein